MAIEDEKLSSVAKIQELLTLARVNPKIQEDGVFKARQEFEKWASGFLPEGFYTSLEGWRLEIHAPDNFLQEATLEETQKLLN